MQNLTTACISLIACQTENLILIRDFDLFLFFTDVFYIKNKGSEKLADFYRVAVIRDYVCKIFFCINNIFYPRMVREDVICLKKIIQ